MRWEELFDHQILVVSGKGGTGKSTVAAALALAAASDGRRVLLCEVEGRGEIAATFGVEEPAYHETALSPGLWGLSITPHEAATEYLRLYFGLDRISRTLLRAGVVDQLVGFAPGFRDLLICGKLDEITRVRRRRADRDRLPYDLLVVDGPPTGQIASFLAAPAAFAELIRVGRMQRQASGIDLMLRERAMVVLVSVAEEMAVAETMEALPAVEAVGVPVAAIVVDRRHSVVAPRGAQSDLALLDAERLSSVAATAGLTLEPAAAEALTAQARAGGARAAAERRFVRTLGSAQPVLELPEVPADGGDGRSRISRLAAVIRGEPDRGSGIPPAASPPGASRRPTRAGATWPPTPGASLAAVLSKARIIVVCGSGGVGKTTVSAALAVALGDGGTDTALLTVDPARRLATTLRLPSLAGDRTRIPLGGGRRLEAMQLDTQRTFDGLIDRYAGSPDRRDRILSNRFYRSIADTLAGTHEYMAMEKLYELATEEAHGAIVIDTPPTRSALSFLDAPTRVTDFLGGRLLRWLMRPGAHAGKATLGMARLGANAFAKTAGRLVGAQVLADVADFLAAFEGMYGGFKERAARVLELLRSPDCVFVVVTAPTAGSLEEAGYFLGRLKESGMHAGAIVVNRWLGALAPLPTAARRAARRLAEGGPQEQAAAAVLRHALAMEPERAAQAEALRRFARRHRRAVIVGVPELGGDVHDVTGLRRVGEHLVPGGAPSRELGRRSEPR